MDLRKDLAVVDIATAAFHLGCALPNGETVG